MKAFHALLKKPFFGRYRVPWQWPGSANRTEWETLKFSSGSGATLRGILGESGSPARGAVVLAHPMGKAAKGHWLKTGIASRLRERGFHVLAFDFNGFGESGEGNFQYPHDVLAAGHALRQRYPDLPLGAHGASFGAAWTLCACTHESHPFEWAVLENPFTSLAEFWHRYPVANLVLKIISTLRPSLERSLNPQHQASRLHGLQRLELHYGEADRITPVEMGYRLEKYARLSLGARVSLVAWSDAGHNELALTHGRRYLDHWIPCTAAFLTTCHPHRYRPE